MILTKILRETKQILLTDGWCKGAIHHPDGRHCIVGAIEKAAGHNNYKLRCDVSAAVGVSLILRGHSAVLANFNDKPKTTLNDVFLVLDETISRLESK